MSKPRYKWWGYVKNIIRAYPELKSQAEELRRTSLTAVYGGAAVKRGDIADKVFQAAARELPRQEQREYEAVTEAIAATERYSNGVDRLKIIRLVYWNGGYTLEGAALSIPCGVASAWRWHGEFIKLVAGQLGFMD
ncbi:MAG: hypothetical protein H6Q60_1171 [Oscillospiraceae bacterium]|nr:hypothetical protein [Oscillospiraceae bacterium]